ncbi:hypothetical protein OXPF_37410 [Oxobacter pfennigii]|uniref:Uncharacterized protein n=1 Tax=Oxobacter pfennigii TaxID=36849 RepID=A0A0P8W531_9CLOT|nr:hypothetical protein [Oxobacter pfennigii]KPU42687.1 hypothetical protein OXPF_37410 [Oxobacter pfennigii]
MESLEYLSYNEDYISQELAEEIDKLIKEILEEIQKKEYPL